MEDKILGSESPKPPDNTDKILGSEDGSENKNTGNKEEHNSEEHNVAQDMNADIAFITRQGGLTTIPQNFEDANGYWKSIHSDNPFEALYLDYKQYGHITPEVVQKNFEVLSAFWASKNKLMNTGSREKIKKRYGEDTVNEALNKLERAFNKIKTKEGIELYYKEIDGKRYNNGLKAIEAFIELSLADGELTKSEANTIIRKGLENGLDEVEVRNHLHQTLLMHDFKPRSSRNLPDVLDNQWMTDDRWKIAQSRTRTIFGTVISSLEEMGELFFYNRQKTTNYLKNANYLPVDITALQNSDKAMEFEEIINTEQDFDRRYLKVIYHLNPSLPFRIDNYLFKTINELFNQSATNYDLYSEAAISYSKGFVHIWLNETDPVNAAKLTENFDYNSFLKFLFRINATHPFYLNSEKYTTPAQLIEKAKTEKLYWYKIIEAITNGQLPAWFEGIGKHEWNQQYNSATEVFIKSDYHDPEDKKLAAVQALIQIIDPSVSNPRIVSDQPQIQLLSIEGSNAIKHDINLTLEKSGFVKAKVYLDTDENGISLSNNTVTFFSQNNMVSHKLLLSIEAMKLIKDKLYSFNIKVKTEYETIVIPVAIKAVFPKKAYYKQLLKYALLGGIFFAFIRFFTGFITDSNSWFSPYQFNGPDGYSAYLPHNYFAYFIGLVLLIGGLVAAIFLIRKIEKI